MADADNIFDIPETPSQPEPELDEEAQIEAVEPLPVVKYQLLQLTAQYPGWSAVYDDPEKTDEIIMFPICAIGSVALTYEDETTHQAVRHFISLPTGDIRDAYEIPNFVCIVAPGQKVEDVVAAVKTERQMA